MPNDLKYHPLNAHTAPEFARSHPALAGMFRSKEPLLCKEVGDGNLNLVFAIWAEQDPSRTVLIKQALPHLRVNVQYQLTLERLRFEASYYELCNRFVPGLIPRLYAYDEDMYLILMENLDHHVVLRKGLIEGNRYPRLAEDLGHFMATMLYVNSDWHIDPLKKKREVEKWINPELCQITELVVFTRPYLDHERNKWNHLLDPQVAAVRSDKELQTEVMELKYGFMTKAQALLHGDLHSGSIMVNENDTRVIDPEFAYYGPIGFDVGALLGNYILNYAAQSVRIADPEARADYQDWLLELVRQTWNQFEREYLGLWMQQPDGLVTPAYRRRFLKEVLQDAVGYAGCKMMRRIIGSAHVEDMDGIQDPHSQARAMSLGIEIAQRLILGRRDVLDVEDMLYLATSAQSLYPFPFVRPRDQ